MEFLHLSQMKLLKRIKKLWWLSGVDILYTGKNTYLTQKDDATIIVSEDIEEPRMAQIVSMKKPIDKFLTEDNQENNAE